MNYFDFFIDSQDKLPEDIEKLAVGKVSIYLPKLGRTVWHILMRKENIDSLETMLKVSEKLKSKIFAVNSLSTDWYQEDGFPYHVFGPGRSSLTDESEATGEAARIDKAKLDISAPRRGNIVEEP